MELGIKNSNMNVVKIDEVNLLKMVNVDVTGLGLTRLIEF